MKTLRPSSIVFAGFALLSMAAGGCMVKVEADVPEVEITQQDVTFAGVPQAAAAGDVSATQSYSQQHQRLELPSGVDTTVEALGVTLTAKSGIDNFDFLKIMQLTMSDGVHPAVQLIDYQSVAGAPSTNVLTIESANPVNTLDEWKTDTATFTVTMAGALPSADWSLDVAVRFAGKLVYNY